MSPHQMLQPSQNDILSSNFTLMPSGRCCQMPVAKSNRHSKSFTVHLAVNVFHRPLIGWCHPSLKWIVGCGDSDASVKSLRNFKLSTHRRVRQPIRLQPASQWNHLQGRVYSGGWSDLTFQEFTFQEFTFQQFGEKWVIVVFPFPGYVSSSCHGDTLNRPPLCFVSSVLYR